MKIIVLETSGKTMKLILYRFLFDDIEDAEKFCEENTDKDPRNTGNIAI